MIGKYYHSVSSSQFGEIMLLRCLLGHGRTYPNQKSRQSFSPCGKWHVFDRWHRWKHQLAVAGYCIRY